MRAVQANRGMASSVQGLYMAELAKIAARKDDGVRSITNALPSTPPPRPRSCERGTVIRRQDGAAGR